MGEISVLVDHSKVTIGRALAEAADPPREWLGLGRMDAGPLRLIVARDLGEFERWSRGRLPNWSAGITLPDSRTIIIRLDAGDPFRTLRHELAHVVLHRSIKERVPLWFDEGYAVVAAGEFDRLALLRMNLAVAMGRIPGLRTLDGQLRLGGPKTEAAYALAGSAVMELARRNPTGRLHPLMLRLREGTSFDEAVLATTGLTLDRFDEAWQAAIRRRYNWAVWLMAGGAWGLLTVVLLWARATRRHREAPRRAALDEGWVIPDDDEEITNPPPPSA